MPSDPTEATGLGEWGDDRHVDESDEVATKPAIWRPIAEKVGGFDLDPAAGCEPVRIAENRYVPADDGLTSPWYGWVWLNPPFSDPEPWLRRLDGRYHAGDVDGAVALVRADPSANWFHNHFATADAICFLDGRDWFLADGDSPDFASMIGAWNPPRSLIEWFGTVGTVARIESETDQTTLETHV